MKIGIVGSIHELGWEVLQSQGHTIIDVKDTSVDSLKNELAEVSGIVLRTAQMPGDVFASRFPDPVLQQVENFNSPVENQNDAFNPTLASAITGVAKCLVVSKRAVFKETNWK